MTPSNLAYFSEELMQQMINEDGQVHRLAMEDVVHGMQLCKACTDVCKVGMDLRKVGRKEMDKIMSEMVDMVVSKEVSKVVCKEAVGFPGLFASQHR